MPYRRSVDTASPQPDGLVLPLTSAGEPRDNPADAATPNHPAKLVDELWTTAQAQICDLTQEEFAEILTSISTRLNDGLPPGTTADSSGKAAFLRSLRLADLALAQACAFGRERAWQRFLELYRVPITQAAIAITGSGTLGHDLADSLYSELYGLKQTDGQRRSPLASYSGRGSLLGWLRTTLAQRYVDHHRRTNRETPLDDFDVPASASSPIPASSDLAVISAAVARTLSALPAEDRFLLASYFLDQQTLLQLGRLLRVHEATISRRLKRLVSDLRKQLLRILQSEGLSRRAAEEALGADPRDLEINLRALLQTSQSRAFSVQQTVSTTPAANEP
jgi:RNA polymerase sigma-70 factor (ECF subfamily)